MKKRESPSQKRSHAKLPKGVLRGRVTCKGTVGSIRSQTTIFIILTILIIIIIATLFILKPTKQSTPQQIQPLQSSIQSCIEEISKQAIFHISERGGYYNLPDTTLENTTPYYLYNDQNLIPTKEKIQREITLYIQDNLPKCIFIATEFSDFKITQQQPRATTEINPTNIEINIIYPLSITKEEKTYQLENFKTNIPIRLGTIYNSIEQIIQEQIKDPTALDPHHIYQVSNENNLQTKMLGFTQDSVIFIITDKKTINQNYTFIFANKYIPKEIEI